MRSKSVRLEKRKYRIRQRVNANCRATLNQDNQAKPRLSIFKSNKHISIQIIDLGDKGRVLYANSTLKYRNGDYSKSYNNVSYAKKLGEEVGREIKAKDIAKPVIDRSGYSYTGRIKAFTDSMCEAMA